MTYKAEYCDEAVMSVFEADDDDAAFLEACELEPALTVFNIFELDEEYNEIRTVF